VTLAGGGPLERQKQCSSPPGPLMEKCTIEEQCSTLDLEDGLIGTLIPDPPAALLQHLEQETPNLPTAQKSLVLPLWQLPRMVSRGPQPSWAPGERGTVSALREGNQGSEDSHYFLSIGRINVFVLGKS
jgi:hypothetical protein